MAKQLYQIGDVIQAGTTSLEVVSVTSQDGPDGEPTKLAYSVRLKADVDAEREEQARIDAEIEAQRKAGEKVSAEQTAKLTPTQTSDAEEVTE